MKTTFYCLRSWGCQKGIANTANPKESLLQDNRARSARTIPWEGPWLSELFFILSSEFIPIPIHGGYLEDEYGCLMQLPQSRGTTHQTLPVRHQCTNRNCPQSLGDKPPPPLPPTTLRNGSCKHPGWCCSSPALLFSLAIKLSRSQGTTGGHYLPSSASMHDNNEKLNSSFPKERPTDAETGWEKLESWRKPWKEAAFQENIAPNPCCHFLRNAKTKSLNLSAPRPVWEWGEEPGVSVPRCLPLS